MREIIKKINVYKFGDCPKVDEKIKDNLRSNEFFGDWVIDDYVQLIKSFANKFNLKYDYSLSLTPDRGEFVKLVGEIDENILKTLIDNASDCPLTGFCYDYDFLINVDTLGLKNACTKLIESIHNEYELMFEDEYLKEHCESNDYEFLENGKLY